MSKKTYLEQLREKTRTENSRKMDDRTFQELLDAGEIGLILMDGGVDLTAQQLQIVKEKAKEQAEQKKLEAQYAEAAKPGYRESQLGPVIEKLIESARFQFGPSFGKNQQAEPTKPAAAEMESAEGNRSSSPVASEKTKQSASVYRKTGSKMANIIKTKQSDIDSTNESMTNAGYLGEIYKLMVKNQEDIKLERQQQLNLREEEDLEDQKRHNEIIKALTVRRRRKPKVVRRRVKETEEKVGEPPKKPVEAPKKAEPTKPAEAPKKPAEAPKKPAEPVKKAEPTKPVEKPKKVEAPKKAEPAKKAEPTKPAKTAEPVKPPEPAKPTATPKSTKVRPPKRTAEDIRKAGVAVVGGLAAVGVTNVFAQKAMVQTSMKESQLDLKSNESGAQEYLNTMNKRGYGYIQQTFPQLKPGGALAKKLGYEKEGVPESVVRKSLEGGNETWYDMAYNYPGNRLGNTEPGDGWKYRGRGLVAITGKANYAAVGKVMQGMGVNVDLVRDPDKLQDTDVAYKAMAAYYAMTLGNYYYKGDWKKGLERLNSYTDRDQALREIIRATAGMGHKTEGFEKGYRGNTGEGYNAKGEHLYVNYERAKASAAEADKILNLSTENSNMKTPQETKSTSGANVNINNITNKSESPTAKTVDDRPAYQRK